MLPLEVSFPKSKARFVSYPHPLWRRTDSGSLAFPKKGAAPPFQATACINFSKRTRFNTRFRL